MRMRLFPLVLLQAVLLPWGNPVWAQVDTPPTAAQVRATLLYPGTPPVAPSVRPLPAQGSSRSIPLAFVLSAAVPGAGQAYNRQWVKAAFGLALEAALVTGYTVWRQQGLDGETAFQTFAHARWSPTQYAAWLNDYTVFLTNEYGASITAPPITIPTGIDFQHPESWGATEQAAANTFFSQIRAIERQVFHPETGATFSHQLPNFGEQQYYELIGKYYQFAPGWDDYAAWKDAEGNFTAAIDPELTGQGGTKPNVTDTFRAYADDHGHANDLLRRASRLSVFFIFNHLMAGVDAAISAKLHNDRLRTHMGLGYGPDGRAQPVATVQVRF